MKRILPIITFLLLLLSKADALGPLPVTGQIGTTNSRLGNIVLGLNSQQTTTVSQGSGMQFTGVGAW